VFLAGAVVLVDCGPSGPPKPPAGHSVATGDDGGDDTAAACGTCSLYECDDDSTPDDVTSESDCADAADSQECADYEWDEGC
jgi:hypothetical protein